MAHTPEQERADARGFEFCARILRNHGFTDSAALLEEAQALCTVKARVLEDLEHQTEVFRKCLKQAGDPKA